MQSRQIDRKSKTLAWALVATGGAGLALAILLSDTLPSALAWLAAAVYTVGIAAAFRVNGAFGWVALVAGIALIAGPTLFDTGMLGFVLLGVGTVAATLTLQGLFSRHGHEPSGSERALDERKGGGNGW